MSSDPPSKKEHSSSSSKNKVIKKGKASLKISKGKPEPDSLGKPQNIEIAPRRIKKARAINLPEEDDVDEIVARLDRETRPRHKPLKLDKVKFEKLEARPDEEEIQEEKWQSSGIPGWWVAAAGACAVLLLLSGLALESWFDGDEIEKIEAQPALEKPDALDENDPEYWFQKRAGSMAEKATRLLEDYEAAKDDVQKSTYTRDPQAYLDELKKNKIDISPRPETIDEVNIYHTGKTGYLKASFEDQDFSPMVVYFTHEKEDLKIDWKATTAWSEVPLSRMKEEAQNWYDQIQNIKAKYVEDLELYENRINPAQKTVKSSKIYTVVSGDTISRIAKAHQMSVQKLRQLNHLKNDAIRIGQKLKVGSGRRVKPKVVKLEKPAAPEFPPRKYTKPVLVRCLLTRRDEFYAGVYNDEDHSAYLLLSKDATHSMWGYVKRDSKLDEELRRLLDHGRFVLDLKKNLRVTLHLRRGKVGALPNQLEIVDLIHPDWVTP